VALGAAAASLVLIAPGTSVAGVHVGFMTQGAAADAISGRLAETTVVLAGDGGDARVSGADLGATVEAQALAETAFAEHPLWNVTAWFPEPLDAPVAIDEAVAAEALAAAVPAMYTDPVDAEVAFDADSTAYVVTPGVTEPASMPARCARALPPRSRPARPRSRSTPSPRRSRPNGRPTSPRRRPRA
jgi:hypothetical protein